jgi:hypothetical protein
MIYISFTDIGGGLWTFGGHGRGKRGRGFAHLDSSFVGKIKYVTTSILRLFLHTQEGEGKEGGREGGREGGVLSDFVSCSGL